MVVMLGLIARLDDHNDGMTENKYHSGAKKHPKEIKRNPLKGGLAPRIAAIAKKIHLSKTQKSTIADRALHQVFHQRNLEVIEVQRCSSARGG